jgi:hypothetical protein
LSARHPGAGRDSEPALAVHSWIPACAGMTKKWTPALKAPLKIQISVIPAKAGTQKLLIYHPSQNAWIPAFAGMTN